MASNNILFAQDSTKTFNYYFGITYSPHGPKEIRSDIIVYSNFLVIEDNLVMYTNESNIFFSSTFGKRISNSLFLILDLEYGSGYYKTKDENDEGYSQSLQIITPKIGFKYTYSNNLKVNPYLRFAVSKTLAFADFEIPNEQQKFLNDIEDEMEKSNSPWGFEFGFGTEMYLLEQLSLFLDAKIEYLKYKNTQTPNKINASKTVKIVGFGLNMYF